uniref:Uncharacterized protein n=1 Tax=Rhizophora mucronata TaxID=61149 RepID=A0A2P2P7G5_RHIMU
MYADKLLVEERSSPEPKVLKSQTPTISIWFWK